MTTLEGVASDRDASGRVALEQQKIDLKLTLKAWEGEFHKSNGRRAGREDIKKDSAIALKYKEYQRVQDGLAGKSTKQKRERPETELPESPSKRRRTPPRAKATPQKQTRFLAPPAPSLTNATQEDEDEYQKTPAVKRTYIGPTPQKNGIVLGIFDSPPAAHLAATPSRDRKVLGELNSNVNVALTPSRNLDKIQESPVQYEERARGSRTPASSGKRFMLDAFMTATYMTPSSKRRRVETEEEKLQATPSSVTKTPAFLRRDNFMMSTIGEEEMSPQRPVLPFKRSFGRSLSGMIKDMRKEAEKDADEELDLLHELEDEAAGIEMPKPTTKSFVPPKVMVQDSQAAGGLDRDGFVPSDVEQEVDEVEETVVRLGRDGKPLKPWKKKGLKRQTRRTNMRPVAKKAQTQPIDDEEAEDEDDVVAETQAPGDDVASDLEAGSDEDFSEAEEKPKPKARGRPKKATATKDKADAEKKPAKRKIKADSHANYRSLKIKNKNSKGKGGGRFGRRR